MKDSTTINTGSEITVIIADDHEIFVQGFCTLFKNTGIKILATAKDGQQLIDKVRIHKPQLVITDIRMPVMDGIKATAIIKKEFPGIKIIALTAFDETWLMEDMSEAGALGFVIKNVAKDELLEGIHTVLEGRHFYCSQSERKLYSGKPGEKPLPTDVVLTEKETEVLKWMCRGYTNKEIGRKMNIHARTVEFHRANLYTKTDTKNLAQLAIFAIRHGLL